MWDVFFTLMKSTLAHSLNSVSRVTVWKKEKKDEEGHLGSGRSSGKKQTYNYNDVIMHVCITSQLDHVREGGGAEREIYTHAVIMRVLLLRNYYDIL